MRWWLLVIVLVVLAGCGSSSNKVWRQEGSTEAQYKRDSYSCERDQPVIYCHTFDCIEVNNRLKNMYRRCMESKGWTLHEVPK
jgi:hypothetical protein